MSGETENDGSRETEHLEPDLDKVTEDKTTGDKATEATIRSQVAVLESEAEQINIRKGCDEPNREVHERVQRLIGLIKDSLRSRHLNARTQKELARLLSLTPNLKGQHVQQLNLLDLAVSTLLESEQAQPSDTPQTQKAQDKNLVFVQETRRQITRQSRAYPNVLRSIFVTGGGTPYIRLISGLSWFFSSL